MAAPHLPSTLALEPPRKITPGQAGYLVTLGEPNTWWKVNTAEETVALLRQTWKELNDSEPPIFSPHAVADSPGTLFVAQEGGADAGKGTPADIAHALMERAGKDPAVARLGPHVIRVLPVESACDASIDAVQAMAAKVLPRHFPDAHEEGVSFAVMSETHSPRVRDTSTGDLVRRVAATVPRSYRVDLRNAIKTIILVVVGQNVCIGVVDDWHALHHYNLRTNLSDAAVAAAAAV